MDSFWMVNKRLQRCTYCMCEHNDVHNILVVKSSSSKNNKTDSMWLKEYLELIGENAYKCGTRQSYMQAHLQMVKYYLKLTKYIFGYDISEHYYSFPLVCIFQDISEYLRKSPSGKGCAWYDMQGASLVAQKSWKMTISLGWWDPLLDLSVLPAHPF